MTGLLRLLASWSVRRLLLFVLVVLAMVAFVKIVEAYRSIPAARAEIAALERQQALLDASAREQLVQARRAINEIGGLEAGLLRRRLAAVRLEIASLDQRRLSRTGFALAAVRGNTDAIADELGAAFRLQLLRREESMIRARLSMYESRARAIGLGGTISALNRRIAALEREVEGLERRFPLLARTRRVPVIRSLAGPWHQFRQVQQELGSAREQRDQAIRAQRSAVAAFQRGRDAYHQGAVSIQAAIPPDGPLREAIAQRQEALSRHWSSWAWEAVEPVLGWAAWVTLLIILAPPAVKAVWFFVVAPAASKLGPVRICPGAGGRMGWATDRLADPMGAAESAVSWQLRLRPGEELLIRPDYLQSSVGGAAVGSQLLLSAEIPLSSLATGLVGLTRIRAEREATVSLSAARDLVDEVGVIEVAEGAALVFKPRNLVGLVRPVGRQLRLQRVWRLGHGSAWLTLQLRHLVFHGPCALVVKGARGVALEPAEGGRRIAGAATMGWGAGLDYSVRRSETFFAYLTGKQSLFVDCFEGPEGCVVYEELPRARTRGGLFGRGLEGIGDALLKIVGL